MRVCVRARVFALPLHPQRILCKETLFQNYSCVLVISHHSLNEERVETAEKSGNFNLEGRTHLCACFKTIVLLSTVLVLAVKHFADVTKGIGLLANSDL